MVKKIFCYECNSTYVGQTVGQLTAGIDKHRKEDSPLGQHLWQFGIKGSSSGMSWEVID